VDRASSGSFALERRAQDDSKNKQRQGTDNGEEQAMAKNRQRRRTDNHRSFDCASRDETAAKMGHPALRQNDDVERGQAKLKPLRARGRVRIRLPVALKTALTMAGRTAGGRVRRGRWDRSPRDARRCR
jgi:hypothetical protein